MVYISRFWRLRGFFTVPYTGRTCSNGTNAQGVCDILSTPDKLIVAKYGYHRSGLLYTSIREGVYMEAFPVFLDWHPKTKKVILPADGEVAYTLRAELAKATARIMIRGGYENQTVLFTAEETITAKEMVDVINEATGRQVKLEIIPRKEYIRTAPMLDDCGRPKEHFETIASRWDDIVEGALSTTHPLMHEILRREPTKPRDALRQLLTENRDYTYP